MRTNKKAFTCLLAVVLLCGAVFPAVPVNAATSNYSDVPADAWYADAVNWCRDNGIMSGTGENTFSPDAIMTRAMLVTVLYRLEGSPKAVAPTFPDVELNSWYADAVGWAAENRLVTGYASGLFGTNDPVSREQIASILWRYADSPDATAEPFDDIEEIAAYARPAVDWARSGNIISGVGENRFNPKGIATRAQVAVILHRYFGNIQDETPTPEPTPEPEPTIPPEAGGNNLQTTTYNLNGVTFTMVFVEGGTFTMGSDTRLSNQAPAHEVTLSSFLIGETEVTRALWNEVMNGSHSSNDLEYPVASVTWAQCNTFVDRLNQRMHAEGLIPDDVNFHMPSEAQWEFAAKGGNQSQGYIYSGSNTLSEVAWTSSDGSSVHRVKLKAPNELGLYDMSGNVYEWVADYAAAYSAEAQTDPCNTTPSNNYIKRGGSFYYNEPERFTSTYRYFYSSTDHTIGLRISLY